MWNSFRLSLALIGLFAVLLVSPARAEEFTAVTNNVPPLKYVKDGVVGGISGDILAELLKRTGHTLKSISNPMPLGDAMSMTERNSGFICVGLVKNPSRAPLFKWVGPYYTFATGIIVKKSRKISIARLAEAKGLVLATVINSASEKKYTDTLLGKNRFKRFPTTREAILALTGDSVDGLLMPTAPAYHLMAKMKVEPNDYVTAIALDNLEMYFAFNTETDDTIIKALQKEFEALKQADDTGMSLYLEILSRHSVRTY